MASGFPTSTELTANKDITQHVVVCSPLEKVQKLTELLKGPLKGQKLLVFAGTKTCVVPFFLSGSYKEWWQCLAELGEETLVQGWQRTKANVQ